jgi:hypothetical protein
MREDRAANGQNHGDQGNERQHLRFHLASSKTKMKLNSDQPAVPEKLRIRPMRRAVNNPLSPVPVALKRCSSSLRS